MASQTSDDVIPVTAECLCKRHKFTIAIPRSSLPLGATTCHCDSCRHFTGALYSIDAPWSSEAFGAIRQSTLKWYDFSAALKILFCGTCSAPMFWESPVRDPNGSGEEGGRKFTVFVGALSNEGPRGLVEVGKHMFVGDTKDGGASMWMRGMNGEGKPAVKRYVEFKKEGEELAEDWPGQEYVDQLAAKQQEADDEVPIRCHCGGVDLVFLRKEAEREFRAKQVDELPRIVDPETRKYVAGFDVCNSCRLSFGSDIFNWAFCFLRHIGFPARGSTQAHENGFPKTLRDLYTAVTEEDVGKRDKRLGTLTVYCSSEGIKRYFCSRCSACVLYAADNRPGRDDMVDLTLGVLRAKEGARAEHSFKWVFRGRIQHREDIVDGWRGSWLTAVESEAEAWKKERGL